MGEQDSSNERVDIEGGASASAPEHGEAQRFAELKADPDGQTFAASNHQEWERFANHN